MRFTTTELLLLALFVIFTVPYAIWRGLGRRSWAPLVVVQIVTGIVLGPAIFGGTFPEIYKRLFNHDVIMALNGIASWAVMMFVWVAGIELDIQEAWQKRKETSLVASLSLVIPFLFGGALAALLLHFGNNWIGSLGSYWQVLMGIGMACAVTALPILVLFLDNLAILRTNFGQRILRYASLDDIAIWGMLALILVDWNQIVRQLGFLLLFVPAAIFVRRLMAVVKEQDRWYLGLMWLGACGLAADWAGFHYMVGAFLSGVVLDMQWFNLERINAFRRHVLLTVMPVFFLSTGLRTSWNIGGVVVFVAAGLLLIASVAGKLISMVIAGRILRWEAREAYIIGWLLQTKALIMIIFVSILLDKHIITSDTFTALLLMAVGSTMLSMPMTAPLLKKHLLANKTRSMGPGSVEENL